jgi:serpin B
MRLLILCIGLAACSNNPTHDPGGDGGDTPPEPDFTAERQLPPDLKDDAAAIAQANNQFACDLYAQLATGSDNTFFSPFSITTALAMIDAGAAGTTDLELRAALYLTLPGERTHAAIGAVLASLDRGRSHSLYTLSTANGLFGQTGFPFLPSFTTTLTQDYAAQSSQLDFMTAPEAARATINSWVDAQTDHKIPALFGPDTIDATTVLVLANAILFKGTWEHKFAAADTTTAAFQLASGDTVQVPTMHKQDKAIATTQIPGGVVGVLPFGGKDLAMVVVVPDQPNGLPALEAQLSATAIAGWMAHAQILPEDRTIQLPRFSLAIAPSLIPVLGALGIKAAFDPATANLSGIDGRADLYIAQLAHQAVIDVNEDGAEAAAATGAGASAASAPSPLIVDRPFVFFIYDHVTGAILFMGRVEDPRP